MQDVQARGMVLRDPIGNDVPMAFWGGVGGLLLGRVGWAVGGWAKARVYQGGRGREELDSLNQICYATCVVKMQGAKPEVDVPYEKIAFST